MKKNALNVLVNYFELEENSEVTSSSLDKFKEALTQKIDLLIQCDMPRLFWILYRIDISEKRVRKLLHDSQGGNAANELAELIVSRQIEKWEARNQIVNPVNEDDFDPDMLW